MENHVGIMVICLSIDKPDVCHCFSTRKRTTPTDQDTCIYINSSSNHGDLFAPNS